MIGWLVLAMAIPWRMGAEMPVGLGGHAVAPLGDRILVVGGTTWKGGEKRWLGAAYTYHPGTDRWTDVGSLPEAVGYAVGIAGEGCLYLLGGSSGTGASRKCSSLELRGGRLHSSPLPDLPEARVLAAGDRVGRRLYVVGGATDPAQLGTATNSLFCLDLEKPDSGWQRLTPLPGRARAVHAAIACGGALYVFGGAHANANGGAENLPDAWRYLPERASWERLPDAPYAARGWSAATDGVGRVALFGGYAASAAESEGKADDFGFTDRILAYNAADRSYRSAGTLPRAAANAVPAILGDDVFLFGGEPVRRQRGAWTWITRVPGR